MNRTRKQTRHVRRGGAYILVLGAATMLTVVGLGTVAVMRTSIGRVAAARDWSAAGVLAESAVEGALSRINTESTWRSDFRATPRSAESSIGGGSCYFTLEDPGDGDLSSGERDSVLIRGVGIYGKARRAYSARADFAAPPVLDVLKHGVYAAGTINCRGVARVVGGGGARCGSTFTNNSTLTADVWAPSVSNSGTIVGEVHVGSPALSPLSDGSLMANSSRATVINYASLSSGAIDRAVLSSGSNPYGAAAANGIYYISVPALSTLRIRRSRIEATLIIQLGLSSTLEISNELHWEKGPSNLPVLIVSATALSSVNLTGSSSPLSEASLGTNFNPVSTPYNGQSDSDTSDTYPCGINGIIHVSTLLASVTVGSAFNLTGTLITDGSLTIDAGANVTYDSTVLLNPPDAYRTGTPSMMPVPGSWVWEPVRD